jgi:hypothetical protein
VPIEDKPKEADKFDLFQEAKIEVGQLPRTKQEQLPGYLAVKIDNCNLEDEEIKFFGVDKSGASVSGTGVEAAQLEKETEEQIAYFNMDKLIKRGQYTENTVEGVVTVDNQELGREAVKNVDSAIYLG